MNGSYRAPGTGPIRRATHVPCSFGHIRCGLGNNEPPASPVGNDLPSGIGTLHRIYVAVLVCVSLLATTLHAASILVLAITLRGCPDDCNGLGFLGVVSTISAGMVVAASAGPATILWRRCGRSFDDLRHLIPPLLAFGLALTALAAAGGLGVLEDAIEGVTGTSLQPPRFVTSGASGITLPEVVAAAYAGGIGASALLGAWLLKRVRVNR